MLTTFSLGILKGTDHSEDLNFKEICFQDVDWIHSSQDRDRWWALVSIVTKHDSIRDG
jgi:hypothetical protein